MGKHFRYAMIPAGDWRRLPQQGEGERGASQEDRPHLIPTTDAGHKLAIVDSAGWMGSLGLCPGEYLDPVTGRWQTGFRFLPQTPVSALEELIPQLDAAVERFCVPQEGGD